MLEMMIIHDVWKAAYSVKGLLNGKIVKVLLCRITVLHRAAPISLGDITLGHRSAESSKTYSRWLVHW